MTLQLNNPRFGNVTIDADTFAELRSLKTKQISHGFSAIVKGGLGIADGLGGIFAWDSTSTLPDDDETTIAPLDGQPGRWVKIAVGKIGPQGPVSTVPGPQGPQGDGLANVMQPTGAALVGYKSRTVADKIDETVSIADYTGTTVARIKAAVATLTARGGGVLTIPRGSYSLDSSELQPGIALPSNIVIEGNSSLLTITGATITGSLFRVINASNVVLRNMLCVGNNKAIADATSGAFVNITHDAAGQGSENIQITNVRLQNFAAERWISIVNSHPTIAMRGIRFNTVSAISQPGNCIGPNSIGISSSVIYMYGVSADIVDVKIDNFYADADYIKCGITIFHRVRAITINQPVISNAGQSGIADDVGAYAINAYANPGELTGLIINAPQITNPRSCGIYLRGVVGGTINDAQISGQTDIHNETLPKAAISTNGSSNIVVNGGLFRNNAFDFNFAASTTSGSFDHALRGVRTSGATRYSVLVNPTSGTGSPDGLEITNCVLDSNNRGIAIQNNQGSTNRNLKNLTISGSTVIARGSTGIDFNNNQTNVTLTSYKIADTLITAKNRGIDAGLAGGDLTINNVIIEDAGNSELTYGLLANNFPQLYVNGLVVRSMGAGYATYTDGANGTLSNVRILNTANGFSPDSLGMVAPSQGGIVGWRVQNLNPVEAGTAGSKYVNREWVYTANGWLEQRVPTGN